MAKREQIRRVRLGNVRTLLRQRCGYALPDDDAGREYLDELLKIVSLGPDAEQQMLNTIEVWAPFVSRRKAPALVARINRIPSSLRWPKPKLLGASLRLINAERERLHLWAIAPCDMSEADLAEQRKAKRRRKRGSQPRAQYLAAHTTNRDQPWIAEGICRATWFKRKKGAQTGMARTRESYGLTRPVYATNGKSVWPARR
jgi:hypothetical protein